MYFYNNNALKVNSFEKILMRMKLHNLQTISKISRLWRIDCSLDVIYISTRIFVQMVQVVANTYVPIYMHILWKLVSLNINTISNYYKMQLLLLFFKIYLICLERLKVNIEKLFAEKVMCTPFVISDHNSTFMVCIL